MLQSMVSQRVRCNLVTEQQQRSLQIYPVKDLVMKLSKLSVGLKSDDWCPYKKRRGQRQREGGDSKMGAEVGGIWLQFKDTLDQQKLEEAEEGPSSRTCRRRLALPTPELQTPRFQNWEKLESYFLSPLICGPLLQ